MQTKKGSLIETIVHPGITSCFSVDRLTVDDIAEISFERRWSLAIVTSGTSKLVSGNGEVLTKQGDCFFISNSLSRLRFDPIAGPLQLYLITKEST